MKKKELSQIDLAKRIRNVWNINCITRIVPNKKRYSRKIKHKNKIEE